MNDKQDMDVYKIIPIKQFIINHYDNLKYCKVIHDFIMIYQEEPDALVYFQEEQWERYSSCQIFSSKRDELEKQDKKKVEEEVEALLNAPIVEETVIVTEEPLAAEPKVVPSPSAEEYDGGTQSGSFVSDRRGFFKYLWSLL